MGQFGGGLSSRGSPGHCSEEVADRRAHRRALHSDVRAVVGCERYRPHEVHGVGIALTEAASVAPLCSDSATNDAGCTVETAQLPMCYMRLWSEDAL